MSEKQSEEVFTPGIFLEKYLTRKNIALRDVGVAPVVIISWGYGMVKSLAAQVSASVPGHWLYGSLYPLYAGEVGGRSVSFVEMPVGAAGTVMIMEELIACGAKTFIGLGWTGSLQPDIPIGSFVIPTSCIREEGTSFHYVDADRPLFPDETLRSELVRAAAAEGASVISGALWTTDAPYRELRSKVERYKKEGVVGVDMETSAMYALGLYREVAVCNLLVVSDIVGAEWSVGFDSEELGRANRLAEEIVVRYLTSPACGNIT